MGITRQTLAGQASNPNSVLAPWNKGVIWEGTVTATRTKPAEKDGQPTGGDDILVELELTHPIVAVPNATRQNQNPQPQQYTGTVTLWFGNGAKVHALLSACEAANSDLLEGGHLRAGCVDEKHTGNIQPMKIIACEYTPPANGLSLQSMQANAGGLPQQQASPQQFQAPQQVPNGLPQQSFQQQPAPQQQFAPQGNVASFLQPQPQQFEQQQPQQQVPTLGQMMQQVPANGAPAA